MEIIMRILYLKIINIKAKYIISKPTEESLT